MSVSQAVATSVQMLLMLFSGCATAALYWVAQSIRLAIAELRTEIARQRFEDRQALEKWIEERFVRRGA